MEGVLKQQTIGSDGMYSWQRKHFRIDEYGNLLVKSIQGNEESTRITLSGAKYAKEWSFSSALSGYGFDIMWTNDDVWSFLVDDESSCLKWVENINSSINLQKTEKSVIFDNQIRIGRDGSSATNFPTADYSDEEYALRTIDKHQQFLSGTTNPLNSTLPYKDASESLRKSQHGQGEFLDDLPIDVKSLRSLHGSNIYNSGIPKRYENSTHSRHIADEDTHDEIASQQSQQSFQPQQFSQQQPDSNARNIIQSHPTSTMSSTIPVSNNQQSALNTSQAHMDYFRSDVSKALFDSTGATLYEPPPPPPMVGAGLPTPSAYPPSVRTDNQRNEYLENMKNIFATTKKSLADTEQELASLRSSQPNPDHLSLQIRCQHLEQQLQIRDQELEKAQSETYRIKLEFEERFKKINDELDGFRNREHDLLSKFKQEIDHRVLRATNENNNYFEASLKSLKAQHQRELRLLQDELNEERKNGSGQVEKEMMLRKRAETCEQGLRKDLHAAQDRIASLEIDLQRVQSTTESSQSSWVREKTRLVAEYTHQIQQLTAEKDALEQDAQRQVQQKVQEMNKKWEASVQNLKGHEMELMRQQWESDHARTLIEQQKKCQRDIESVRSEERTLAAQEMESLRSAFMQRERQTAQDLIELEKLHAKRVQQLDFQYQQEKNANEQLKQRLNDLLLDQDRKHQDSMYQTDSWQRKNHELTLQCDQLKRDLKAIQEEVADSKAGENHAREQLRQLSMELKLLQAERAELQRQSTGHGVELSQWKQVVQEQEKNYHALETTTRVAKEEIAFLEHENHRLKTENAKLMFDMEKADRLIYGVSQHTVDPKRTYPMKLDSKFHDAANFSNNMSTSNVSFGHNTPVRTGTGIVTPSSSSSNGLQRTSNVTNFNNNSNTSKLALDSTVLSHSRQSFHKHQHHSPIVVTSTRNKSPRRSSPVQQGSNSSSLRSSSVSKRRWA